MKILLINWGNSMRYLFIVSFLSLTLVTVGSPLANALSDDDAKNMLRKLAHAYYESDADTFLDICLKFEKPMFKKRQDVVEWMRGRTIAQETFVKIKATVVYGVARITSEKLGRIDFRFDGTQQSPSQVIVVTARVDRVIEFDESIPVNHRKIDQLAYLKIYVTLVKGRLIAFKSDEINLGYSFAGD